MFDFIIQNASLDFMYVSVPYIWSIYIQSAMFVCKKCIYASRYMCV